MIYDWIEYFLNIKQRTNMSADFSTFLVLATFLTGIIWAIDAWFFAKRRKKEKRKEPIIVEYARSFFPIILIVLLLRSFLIEPFRIPSGSMMPTLLVGDFILVNKYIYGIRLPAVHKKVIPIALPERGDVVVFRYPENPSLDYIKRVIGVPGDTIVYYNKTLYINGQPQAQTYLDTYVGVGGGAVMTGAEHRQETLTGVTHEILIQKNKPILQGEWTVPDGYYFMMGDNRDNSNDSRFWGMVPEENLVGKAVLVWMNWDMSNSGPDWGRIGLSIK